MRNKSINLAAILLVALFNGAAAFGQGDHILVGGNAPLRASHIEKAIEFFEWAFESAFTAEERHRFQALTTTYHRQHPERSAKETRTLIDAITVVKAKDKAKQDEMRKSFNEGFVADLRRTNDASSDLMLPIYERGRVSGLAKNDSNLNQIGGSIAGRWIRRGGIGGSRDYTGKTLYNNSNDVIFEFNTDGTVRFINEKRTLSITQCKMSETMEFSGRYTADGSSLMMDFAAGSHISFSTCDAKRNFNKAVPQQTLTKKFVVKKLESIFRPDAPLILCLDGEADDQCFERER